MKQERKPIRIADSAPATWRKVQRNQGQGPVSRLPCPRLTRTGHGQDTAMLYIPSAAICASKVNLFHDGHGRIAIQPDPRGDYVVRQEGRTDRSYIGIPKALRDLIPMGHTPVTLEKDGDLIAIVVGATS